MANSLNFRDWTIDDIPSILRILSNPNVSRYLPDCPRPFAEKDAVALLQAAMPMAPAPDGQLHKLSFAIENERMLVGGVVLHSSAGHCCGYTRHCATLELWLDEQSWGKGIGTLATTMARDLAEKCLFSRLEIEVFGENARAISCLKKCGFVQEAERRERYCRDGKYSDCLLFAAVLNGGKLPCTTTSCQSCCNKSESATTKTPT